MKILFISEYYPPIIMGGGEINLAQIAQELAKQNHEIIVLTSSFPTLATEEVVQGVTIIRKLKTGRETSTLGGNFQRRFSFPRSIRREAQKIIAAQNLDVVHFIGTSIIAAPQLKSLNKPLFATIESYPTLCPKGDRLYHGKTECTITCTAKEFIFCQKDSQEIGKMKNKWYLKYNPLFLAYTYHYYTKLNRALSGCTLISISKYVQQLLLQQNHQSEVIPNILDVKPFSIARKKIKEKAVEKENKKEKKVHILYLGSLIKSKGPQILLEALKGIGCRCDLYGEGNLKPELQEYIQKNNLDAEIHPLVPYEQIPKLYANTDIVVFPSLWPEPFGRIAIEGLAAGKIVIASKIGGIKETVQNTRAIGVKPGDSTELHQAIKQALDLLKERSMTSRRHVRSSLQEQYAPTKIAALYVESYKKGSLLKYKSTQSPHSPSKEIPNTGLLSGLPDKHQNQESIDYTIVKKYWNDSFTEQKFSYAAGYKMMNENLAKSRFLKETEIISKVIQELPSKKMNCLDIGCGNGKFSFHFSTLFSHVTGVDFAPNSIQCCQEEAARRGINNVTFVCQDLKSLHLSASFDFIFVGGVLMYINDDDLPVVLHNIYNHLTPQGTVIFREPLFEKKNRLIKSQDAYPVIYRSVEDFENAIKSADLNLQRKIVNEGYSYAILVDYFLNKISSFFNPTIALQATSHFSPKVLLVLHLLLGRYIKVKGFFMIVMRNPNHKEVKEYKKR